MELYYELIFPRHSPPPKLFDASEMKAEVEVTT